MAAPSEDALGAMGVAILSIPLIPYHSLRAWQIWRKQGFVPRSKFLLSFHALSALSILAFVLNGVWGGACTFQALSELCQGGAEFIVGTSGGGFFSNLGNLGFTINIWLQACLTYYAGKEIAYTQGHAHHWRHHDRKVWRFVIVVLVLLALLGFGVTLPHSISSSFHHHALVVAALIGIAMTLIVSFVTFALVLRLHCTINFTYRILPYLSTRKLLIIATLQSVSSLGFAGSGGYLLVLQDSTLNAADSSEAIDLVPSLTVPLLVGSTIYSLSYAGLALSCYWFAWLLRKYSAGQSSEKPLVQVGGADYSDSTRSGELY